MKISETEWNEKRLGNVWETFEKHCKQEKEM